MLLKIYELMVKSRVLEERLIKIYKVGEALFWIGGPGEEAFGVPLGLLIHKGQGLQYDWLHLHYRCTPTMVALGFSMEDAIRLAMNRATDSSTGGRNFPNHYCVPQWNVAPVTSTIGTQYSIAIGTALVQARTQSQGITIVTGGDAGTAEGDFASCLIWASRQIQKLPLLISVQNNSWGISTCYHDQHGEDRISDRGKAFGMKTITIDGNDPVESYFHLSKAMDYIRKTGQPVLLEAMVSRLYGHSSATGANLVSERDCILDFEEKLQDQDILTPSHIQQMREKYEKQAHQAQEKIRQEPVPQPQTIWDHVYKKGLANWRKF